MIRVKRGPEPRELQQARDKGLKKAVDAFNQHGAWNDAIKQALTGYQVARKHLFKAQHEKCAYCEQRLRLAELPTEHFRPKAEAKRGFPGAPGLVEAGYWWLAWSWNNLFFACATCNSQANKGNWFPLEPGSAALSPPAHAVGWPLPHALFNLSQESPTLLDPGDPKEEDPLDHLRWVPVDRGQPTKHWAWALKKLSSRGRVTARILGLDLLADRMSDVFKPLWDRFARDVLAPSNERVALSAWAKLSDEVARPEEEFAGAKWSMLDSLRTSSPRAKALNLPTTMRPS